MSTAEEIVISCITSNNTICRGKEIEIPESTARIYVESILPTNTNIYTIATAYSRKNGVRFIADRRYVNPYWGAPTSQIDVPGPGRSKDDYKILHIIYAAPAYPAIQNIFPDCARPAFCVSIPTTRITFYDESDNIIKQLETKMKAYATTSPLPFYIYSYLDYTQVLEIPDDLRDKLEYLIIEPDLTEPWSIHNIFVHVAIEYQDNTREYYHMYLPNNLFIRLKNPVRYIVFTPVVSSTTYRTIDYDAYVLLILVPKDFTE